jgi:hypothetical protein
MTDHIKAVVARRAADEDSITVQTKDGEIYRGTCTFAGTQKFRVDTADDAMFFTYEEVEAVN